MSWAANGAANRPAIALQLPTLPHSKQGKASIDQRLGCCVFVCLPGIPGSVEFEAGRGGLPTVVLKHACGASAQVRLEVGCSCCQLSGGHSTPPGLQVAWEA